VKESLQTKSLPKLNAYQRIVVSLREDILSGKYAPGSLLPSTEEFAVALGTSYYTVHTALKHLDKEGWVKRLQGHGTYVTEPEQRYLHAGIYHSLDIFSDEEAFFQRRLNSALVAKLHALGKTTQLFVDSRPEMEQTTIFPPLAQAMYQRHIHCVIAPNVNSKGLPILTGLTMPFAMMNALPRKPGVNFDEVGFAQGGIKRLAEQGCRSIGFITNVPPIDGDFRNFTQEMRAAGLETRAEWMLQPSEFQAHLVEYGYRAFRQLWKSAQRPDSLLVYPDTAARGVVTAILKEGVRVPDDLKLVLHRNAHVSFLCPFPVTWAISDEHAAAEGLVISIQKQFDGERPKGMVVPYTFEYDDAARWRD
jgi:DNA-binding LacI/PurR family transcriptional regulator